MQNFWNNVLTGLPVTAALAIVTGIVSCLFYALTRHYLNRWSRYRLLKRLAKYAEAHGAREVALVLSARHDIRNAAKEHLNKENRGAIELRHVHEESGFGNDESDWFDYLEEIKKEIRTIRELGVTRIYLFTNLPIAMATLAGATLTNGPEVIIHHHDSGTYYHVGRISTETIRL